MLKDFTPLQRLVLAGLAGVILVAAGAVALGRSRALPPSFPPFPAPPAARAGTGHSPVTVSVSGAVAHPGLYTLPPGATAWDAVQAAGGLTPTADVGRLNLTKPLKQGVELHIREKKMGAVAGLARAARPPLTRPAAPPLPASAPPDAAPRSGRSARSAPGAVSSLAAPLPSAPVSLTSATVAQLARVPGLTKLLAEHIVAFRKTHGAFRTVSDLLLVPGMTPGVLAQAQPYLVP